MAPYARRTTLDASVRVLSRGRVLLGGRPTRLVWLSPGGARALAGLLEPSRKPPGGAAKRPATPKATARLGALLAARGFAHCAPPRADAAGLTVVVPAHDRLDALDRCLASARGGSHGVSVLVVDDGSSCPDALAAIAERHGARVVRRATSGGPAAARNAGLGALGPPVRGGAGDIVAFLDSDCVAPPGWLEALRAHFDDETLGALAPRVSEGRCCSPSASPPAPAGGRRRVLERYLAARSPLDLGDRPSFVEPGGAVPYVPAAALLVRRRALGVGFDEALRYGEDVDALWRLHANGWRVHYDPGVEVAHEPPHTWGELLARRLRYGTSAAPLDRRHPGSVAPVGLEAAPMAVLVLAAAGRPAEAGTLALVATARLARVIASAGRDASCAPALVAETARQALSGAARAVPLFAPLLAVAGPLRRRGAVAAATLLFGGALEEWWRRRPQLDPLSWCIASAADDVAYALGVWCSVLRERRIGPLVPAFGRRSPRVATACPGDTSDAK